MPDVPRDFAPAVKADILALGTSEKARVEQSRPIDELNLANTRYRVDAKKGVHRDADIDLFHGLARGTGFGAFMACKV